MAEGERVRGMTLLAGEIYLLRWKERDQVEVYDVITYRFQHCLTVPNPGGLTDMTSCEHNRCVYIGDHDAKCVHRLDVQGAITRWAVNDVPHGLSVNAAHNVIVTCSWVGKIKVFSSRGVSLRELTLPGDIIKPWHVIQTRNGQFIVCHGDREVPIPRVCLVSLDGRDIVHSHGQPGSDSGQYDLPARLAVDDNEFVFVVDIDGRRVTSLSRTLEYLRKVVSRDKLVGWPVRLCIDTQRQVLYVAENDWKDYKWSAGRVRVFSV